MKKHSDLSVVLTMKQQKIVEDARKEAESILAVARKSAKETAENTQSEIKLFAGQAVKCIEDRNSYLVDQ